MKNNKDKNMKNMIQMKTETNFLLHSLITNNDMLNEMLTNM